MKFKTWLQKLGEAGHLSIMFTNRPITFGRQTGMVCRAKNEDIATMVKIEELIYGKAPWNYAAFATDLRRHDRLYLVLKNRVNDVEQVIGFIGGAFDWHRHDTHITNFGVHPDYQGQGCGTGLLQTLKQVSIDYGMQTMSLEVRVSNHAAQRLYHRLGFVDGDVKRHYYLDDHEDALDMTASLIKKDRENDDE